MKSERNLGLQMVIYDFDRKKTDARFKSTFKVTEYFLTRQSDLYFGKRKNRIHLTKKKFYLNLFI